jgi:Fe-S-cluster-containing hydrogenase component 2
MKESTRIMLKKHGWRIDRFIHNYIYFAFYYPYVKIVQLVLPLAGLLTWFKPLSVVGDFVFSRYHSKVISVGDTQKIFSLNEDITAISEKNKRIIPMKYAFKILFKEADYIAAMDCPCKKAYNDKVVTEPSCFALGKGLASFWLDHGQKYHARKVTQKEALDTINKLRKLGYINQAFFKVATGGSTGVICTCHPDTCVSLKASAITKKIHPYLSQNIESGYSVQCDTKKCKKCGTCVKTCHFGAIKMVNGIRTYNKDLCLGCELCVENCAQNALSLYVDPVKAVPLDIDLVKKEFANR